MGTCAVQVTRLNEKTRIEEDVKKALGETILPVIPDEADLEVTENNSIIATRNGNGAQFTVEVTKEGEVFYSNKCDSRVKLSKSLPEDGYLLDDSKKTHPIQCFSYFGEREVPIDPNKVTRARKIILNVCQPVNPKEKKGETRNHYPTS